MTENKPSDPCPSIEPADVMLAPGAEFVLPSSPALLSKEGPRIIYKIVNSGTETITINLSKLPFGLS